MEIIPKRSTNSSGAECNLLYSSVVKTDTVGFRGRGVPLEDI